LTYRFMLACLLVLLPYAPTELSVWTLTNTQVFVVSGYGYLFTTALSLLLLTARLTTYALQAQLLIFTDIVFLTLIMHACGGIKSGLGLLLAISIASGGLLIGGRCSMLFAALASLAVLAEQAYATQLRGINLTDYPHSGMMGAAFFTIALLAHVFARKAEQANKISDLQKKTILKLEDLNQYIIQHLQSGIIITDGSQSVQLINDAALELTHSANTPPKNLADISGQLALAFTHWQKHKSQDRAQLDGLNQGLRHCRFMSLPTQNEQYCMITIEDNRLYQQRLQQSKLASLGRLAASIAHEIRNPLSAISHAGQLLSENPQLPDEDQHLTQIIRTHCGRVNRIIEDILLLSKRHDAQKEKILLHSWLDDFLSDFLATQPLEGAVFCLVDGNRQLEALVDPHHLRQILDNLCQNALRYGQPELGPIVLRCLSQDQAVCVEVVDNGSGIDEATRQHLFEPFFTTSRTGTGLGLYVCKELAELNQAKLSYFVTEDQRSCFQLRLLNPKNTRIEL